MKNIKANEATATRRRVYFDLRAADGISPAPGETGQPQVSVDGAAWTNTGISAVTEIGNGRYYADLTQALVATAGLQVETRYKTAGTADCPGDSASVVGYDPYSGSNLGLTNLDATVSSRNATTPPTAAAIATAVEQQIMDETDTRAVLAAIVAKINSTDTNLAGLSIAAIAAAVWDELKSSHTVTGSFGSFLDALISSRLAATADFNATMKTSLNAATPTVLLTPGTATGQVTLASGILSVNMVESNSATFLNGDGTAQSITGTGPWTVRLDAADAKRLLPHVGSVLRMGSSDGVITASNTSTFDQTITTWNGGTPTAGVYSITAPDAAGSAPTASQVAAAILAATLNAPRALDTIADGSITVNDAFWSAVGGGTGKGSVNANALTYAVKTPFTGTVLRTFTIDSATAPLTRS